MTAGKTTEPYSNPTVNCQHNENPDNAKRAWSVLIVGLPLYR